MILIFVIGDGTASIDRKVSYIFLINDFILLTQKLKNKFRLRVIVPLKGALIQTETLAEEEKGEVFYCDRVTVRFYNDVSFFGNSFEIRIISTIMKWQTIKITFVERRCLAH